VFVAWRIRSLIIGKSAEPSLRRDIDKFIEADPGVEHVFNVITFQVGPQIMLAAKIKMHPGQSIEQAVTKINELEKQLKQNHPVIGWSFIEPDVHD